MNGIPTPRMGEQFDLLALVDDTPQGRFERFHRDNPHVYDLLARSARFFREQTGQRQCGISLLFERVRWVLAVETTEDAPKLNNNYRSYYSRLLMEREPDLAGMFGVRTSDADKWDRSRI